MERWVFLAPIGYLNAPRSIGKSLIHDPERAPLVRRAFEDYSSGRFTKEQLLKHVRTWSLTNRRRSPLTSQAIGVLLRNQLCVCRGRRSRLEVTFGERPAGARFQVTLETTCTRFVGELNDNM